MSDFRKHEDYLLDTINDLRRDHANKLDYLVTVLTIARLQDLMSVRVMIDQLLRELQPSVGRD